MAKPGEEWRDVVGYEGIYQVSSLGRIKRILVSSGTPGGLLTPKYQNGYPCVHLCGNGNGRGLYYVHRLVARAFLGEAPRGKPEVNHIDGNRADSSLHNLEWCDRSYNVRDARKREWLSLEPGKRGEGIKIFDKWEQR
jgi:hypothetical protein